MNLEARFWAKVRRSEPNACWEWLASKNACGYGSIGVKPSTKLAHRVSWELHNGPIPDGMQVLHRCDNPACVNPRHLWLGTHKQNMEDKAAKGRVVTQRGSRQHKAKLTESLVQEIRERLTGAYGEQSSLAREYNVSSSTIRFIWLRTTWKHI